MPAGAEILTVRLQHERFVMWALVDPEGLPEGRRILCVVTGEDFMLEKYLQVEHIGTVPQVDGNFIWHFFEADPPR